MTFQPPIRDSDVVDGLNVRYLKIFGLWSVINDYRTTGKKNAVIKSIMISTFLFSVPYIICQCLSYFVITVDVQKLTILNLHILPGIQMICKILVFWFRMGNQCRLYDLITKDFLGDIPKNKVNEVKKIYINITKKCNLFCKIAYNVNASVVIMSIVNPEIPIDYITNHTGSMAAVTGGKMKILGAWYPVPMSQSPYYEVIFIYETILFMLCGILLSVYAALFFQVLMGLYAQFTVLGHHISSMNLGSVNTVEGTTNKHDQKNEEVMYEELKAMVKAHQKLLSYANELKGIYNPLVTLILGVGISVLIVAVFLFLFGQNGGIMFVLRSFQFLVYQGVEVSMFCVGSSYLEDASTDLHFAIYSSDWYKADVKFRKAAQMVMLRARKGVTLMAIRMYPVNIETIMTIMQFTYSVVALMSKMSE